MPYNLMPNKIADDTKSTSSGMMPASVNASSNNSSKNKRPSEQTYGEIFSDIGRGFRDMAPSYEDAREFAADVVLPATNYSLNLIEEKGGWEGLSDDEKKKVGASLALALGVDFASIYTSPIKVLNYISALKKAGGLQEKIISSAFDSFHAGVLTPNAVELSKMVTNIAHGKETEFDFQLDPASLIAGPLTGFTYPSKKAFGHPHKRQFIPPGLTVFASRLFNKGGNKAIELLPQKTEENSDEIELEEVTVHGDGKRMNLPEVTVKGNSLPPIDSISNRYIKDKLKNR